VRIGTTESVLKCMGCGCNFAAESRRDL